MSAWVRACMHGCVGACMGACVHGCVRACMCACVHGAGEARHGRAQHSQAWRGVARRGAAWPGMARHGAARRGTAWPERRGEAQRACAQARAQARKQANTQTHSNSGAAASPQISPPAHQRHESPHPTTKVHGQTDIGCGKGQISAPGEVVPYVAGQHRKGHNSRRILHQKM